MSFGFTTVWNWLRSLIGKQFKVRTLILGKKTKDLPGPYFKSSNFSLYESMCKHCCTQVAQWTCARVTRGHWEQITHFVSISRILNSVYLNIFFHRLSFTLNKLISINIFPRCSIKISRTFKGLKSWFQVLSRPWKLNLEIEGFQGVTRCRWTLTTGLALVSWHSIINCSN